MSALWGVCVGTVIFFLRGSNFIDLLHRGVCTLNAMALTINIIQNSNTYFFNAEAFPALWCADRTSKCSLQERPLMGLLCVSSSPQAF